jgi:hypothetical protein
MSSDLGKGILFKKAKKQEQEGNWFEAAKSYEKALQSESRTPLFAGRIWDRIGFCYNRASRQVKDPKEFKKLRQQAVKAYEKAAQFFEKEDNLRNKGKSAQCSMTAEYLRSWLASSPSEQRKTLDECRILGKESLEAYEKAGDKLNYGKMSNDLLLCLYERLRLASDWREMKSISQEGIDCAKKALAVLSKLDDKRELLQAFSNASLHGYYAANISEQEEERKELIQQSLSHSEKALELSKEVGEPFANAMANWGATLCTLFFTEKISSSLEYAKEMLRQGVVARDNYLQGVASNLLALVTNWIRHREEDPDKKKEEYEKIIRYAEDAVRYLRLVSQDFDIAEAYQLHAEGYSYLARDVATSLEEKRVMSKKAVEIGRKGLQHAIRSGSPDATGSTLHALSKVLHFYSKIETGKNKKKMFLEEALAHREEYNKILEEAFPFYYWSIGVGKNYEGLIKADLARIETAKDKEIALLESAASNMKEGVARCEKWTSSHPVPHFIASAAAFGYEFGGILEELYLLTEDRKNLTRAIETYKNAANNFKKADLPSRAAECYWKTARNQDRLGMHQKAAKNFESASTEYTAAAPKIPHFGDFYRDYATYMKAWSEIEKAKSAHKNEEYALAMKHYKKTANLLKQSKRWNYLSLNFLAWSLLEQAEDLSRKQKIDDALDAFKKAAELFREANEAFLEEIGKIQTRDEKEKAVELGKASVRKKDYCLARVSLEEARDFDRKGDYAASAERYDLAATTFERLLETAETTTEQNEMQMITCMSRAWQKMKTADEKDSPELFHEASKLFLKAKEYSTRRTTTLLASGNSTFCKALKFGTKFEATRDKEDYSNVKKFLASAANYYSKAGFENASLWTNATEMLFDAYNYVSSAEIEATPEKKIKIFLLAEKCLGRSAELYETAGYMGKRAEVLNLLKTVKEKREFALSLRELLTAPSDASSTSMISAPSSTVEEPVGLSKFEGAFVQANLIVGKREVVFGESLRLEIHVANLGKNAAFLTRLDDIIPEGFDLIEKPRKGMVEDGYLNLRGCKLAALETEEMRLAFKPRKKGEFVFKPRIHYRDEAGEDKSCELEQVAITVREIGIRRWLKGPC